MRRNEFRQPLRRRGAWEKLWAKRPSSLWVASVSAIVLLTAGTVWLSRVPYPYAGEPVIVVKIPPVAELNTASTDPAPRPEAEAPETPSEDEDSRKVEILEAPPQETVETEAAIIISPRRSLKPAPFAEVSETGPYGALPRIGAGNKKPHNIYARPVSASILYSNMPKVAIALGGMGLNTELTQKAIKSLPGEVTFAFAPYGENLQVQVNKARADGHEVMLQLPLEPFGFPAANPGPKTLMAHADAGANLDALAWHMGRFAGYTGITNYMGARFLTDAQALRPVLAEMKKRGVVFLDDGQAARSMAAQVGQVVGLPVRNGVKVIDLDATEEGIEKALEELETEARDKGVAIGTGTGLDVTIDTLDQWSRSLSEKGILLVPVSAAYRGRAS
ncbi:divergent polysaccharide deacetylase family protein [Nordella sp. HKS 07]|uniref:divergent polysaccharide deacetylase family protein n=1 Tax=Nordella sp. HKS 07 TaxID=2712222 RepID=UPI0013E1EF7C|nr:divergent polysaccharide deacetylase family protein [Nordella sp. HKS 07]QIG47870.1 divergent polysaccharide deacetylase family protein [Nordella sp. HKS 07]